MKSRPRLRRNIQLRGCERGTGACGSDSSSWRRVSHGLGDGGAAGAVAAAGPGGVNARNVPGCMFKVRLVGEPLTEKYSFLFLGDAVREPSLQTGRSRRYRSN